MWKRGSEGRTLTARLAPSTGQELETPHTSLLDSTGLEIGQPTPAAPISLPVRWILIYDFVSCADIHKDRMNYTSECDKSAF